MRKCLLTLFICLWNFHTVAHAGLPPIKPGVPGKKRGDIIAPMLDEQIAAWCDFDKQIIVTRTNILCVYVGDKKTTAANTTPFKSLVKEFKQAKTIALPKESTPYQMSEYDEA